MTHSTPRIMVVDDEEEIVELLTRNLRRAGYEVLPMSDSVKAWELFQERQPDIVVTDLKMPRMDGEQLTQHIKELSPRTPVVVLTGHGTQPDVERLIRLGVAWVLYKPLREVKDLIALAGQLLDLERRTVELANARDMFDQAMAAMSEALFLTDQHGLVLRVNQAALDMLDVGESEVIGWPLPMFWTNNAVPASPEEVIQRSPQGRISGLETELRSPSGAVVPVSLSYAAMRDVSGQITGLLAVARDVREVRALADAIRELSSPVIPIFDQVIVLPLVGHIDSRRAQEVISSLLEGIQTYRAKVAIVDITGVPLVDTQVANHLVQSIQGATLLGTQCLLVGIRPEIAASIVSLGVRLDDIQTSPDLQHGVRQALKMIGLELRPKK